MDIDERNNASMTETAMYIAVGISVINLLVISFFVYQVFKGGHV
jgi:hypothetical protein